MSGTNRIGRPLLRNFDADGSRGTLAPAKLGDRGRPICRLQLLPDQFNRHGMG